MQKAIAVSVVIIAIVASAVALIYTESIMIPFVFAVLFAFILAPIVQFFETRCKMGRALALLFTFVAVVGVFALICIFTVGTIQSALANVDQYEENVRRMVSLILTKLESWGVKSEDFNREQVVNSLRKIPVLQYFGSAASSLFSFVGNSALVFIFVAFLLSGKSLQLPDTHFFRQIESRIYVYLVVKVITSAATGILTAFFLYLLGIDMAIMFGIFAFFLNFIPTFGSIIALLLPLPVALVQSGSLWTVIGVLALPGMVQMIVGNIIEPRMMGRTLDMHPVTTLIALMFWGLIWGVPGMFLAMPLTVVIMIFLEASEGGKPIAEIMAGRLPGSKTA